MPAPAVYVVGAVTVVAASYAFWQFVYEPHIAPRIEEWAESYLERRRRQRAQRQGPVAAQPVFEHGDENQFRRSFGSRDDNDEQGGNMGRSVELEQLFPQEASAWEVDDNRQSGLRFRRTAGIMDESNVSVPYELMSPTHVLSDLSVPSTPTSAPESDRGSRTHSPHTASTPDLPNMPESTGFRPSTCAASPHIPPTPISICSTTPSRVQTPNVVDVLSWRSSSPDAPAMYNTALMSSIRNMSDHASAGPRTSASIATSRLQSPFSDYHMAAPGRMWSPYSNFDYRLAEPAPSIPGSRIQSPFSDVQFARSPTMSPRAGAVSPFSEALSDFDLPSDGDSDSDAMSMRSGMFSPDMISCDELTFDVRSMHGSEGSSWESVGRRTPEV